MRDLKIAYGNSRQAKTWPNKTITFEELCDRLKTSIRTSETAEEYPNLTKAQRDDIKDKGGFVGGHLQGNHRRKDCVVCRSILAYDMDNIPQGFLDELSDHIPNLACWYTTHSHTAEKPRARVIMPVTRDMTPDEFIAVARFYAADHGFIETLDPCCFQPHQLMYWPTCSSNGEYRFGTLDGDWLDPDSVLAAHPEWRDCSLLPTTPQESRVLERTVKKQKDPCEKDGIVGAFCRAYPIQDVIDAYLPDVYAPSADDPNRYDYIPGEGSSGLVVYDDKFAYSHHATDPAGETLCNAFDLVRMHKFGDLGDRESFNRMCDLALEDEKVKIEIRKEREEQARTDFQSSEDWRSQLRFMKRSTVLENSLHNITLILENDEGLKNIVFNQLADGMEIKGPIPWEHPARFWRDADDAQLICYVDAKYGTFSARNYQIGVAKVVDDHSYHPVKQFFASLPSWDGVPRVDTLLIDYLGAVDSPYVRAVTRKTLCAAVARIMRPGIKFDYILVLNGPQGIGKSTLVAKLGRDWYSDSLSLTDMNDKTAAEKLMGNWIMEVAELAGMRKADVDRLKAFISRQDDKYRASFGRRVTPHPRQCVFFGTTNSDNGYLRDITGNRRFWNVRVPGTGVHSPWELTDENVQQIWAEALVLYHKGEKLFLDQDLEETARMEQSDAMEQDDREGLVRAYLEMLLPEKWDKMDIIERHGYVNDPEGSGRPPGVNRRKSVCNLEIWCECFGKQKGDIRPADSYAIAAIMSRIEGWEKSETSHRIPVYGKQRVYVRTAGREKPATAG